MAVGDGSVDIRITGSVDPSVAASASEAKAALGGLGDASNSLRPGFDASAASLKQLIAQTGSFAAAQKALAAANGNMAAALEATSAAQAVNTVATDANTKATINNRAAYEATVLVHEALQGRFSRMASSSLILTQQLGGQSLTTNAVAFATSGLGAAILGTIAVIGAATVAGIKYEEHQKELQAIILGVASASGLSAQQLDDAGNAAANWASQSESQSRKAAIAFAEAGVQSQDTITQLSASVETYAQLTGVKFADAQKTLAEAMQDPVKGAELLHQQLGILDGDQIEQIQRLTEMGDKQQAVAILTQALTDRTNEANQAGVGAAGAWGTMTNALSNLWTWLGKVDEEIQDQMIPGLAMVRQKALDAADAIRGTIQLQTQLNDQSATGLKIFKTTPEGRSIDELADLKGKYQELQQALVADTALHGANSDAVRRDREALEDYGHAVHTYLTPVQKKLEADALDVKIAAAKHAHNQQLVRDLTEQKALLQEAGKIESDNDAKALASGAGDVAGARVRAPKGSKGPDIVSQWEEQLHQTEILSDNFFADQTANELKFWQDKLSATKEGSKEWLAVQGKIYDASKQLAHQDYDEHIATLNDRLEADRGDFKKFQADWQEKLAYIASKFGDESKEYKDAHRQMEEEDRRHRDQMIRDELSANSKEVQALKAHLQALAQLRQEYAKAAEEVITEKAQGSLLAEVSAAVKIGQLHQQLAQQEIADAEAVFTKEDADRQKGLADALAAWGAEDDRYKQLKADELAAEQKFQDQIRILQARAVAQQIADINRVKAAYHSYIDGMVSSTITGLSGVIAHTETWQQAISGIFQSMLGTIDQILSRIVSNWIVNLIVGQGTQKATALSEISGYAGVAGAAGVASMAAAPWPIDLGAPAFGAAMAAQAAAFSSLVGLDKGTNYLPEDMVVQAHAGERVIPRADNRKLIQILETTTVNAQGPGGKNEHYHLHLHGDIIHNPSQLRQWFENNSRAVGAGMRQYVRQGGNISPVRR